MSRWFRVYDDMVDDPKVQRLSPELFKGLVNLWCLASKSGGILPLHDEIAFKLRISEQKATKLLDDLVTAGLLDHDESGVTPHNWNGRQHKNDRSNERVKRHRERKRNADVTVTVTAPETETETDSSEAKASADPSTPEKELFDRAKAVLGGDCGGQLNKLFKAKGKNIPATRAVVEQAASASDPRRWFAGAVHSAVKQNQEGPSDANSVVRAGRDLIERAREAERVQAELRCGSGGADVRLLAAHGRG